MIKTTDQLWEALDGGIHIRVTNPIIPDKLESLKTALDEHYIFYFLVVEETSSHIPHIHLLLPGQDRDKAKDVLSSLDLLKPWTNADGKEVKGNGLSSTSNIRKKQTVAKYVGKCEEVYTKGVDPDFYKKLLKGSYQKGVDTLAIALGENEDKYFADELTYEEFCINYLRIKLDYNHSLNQAKSYLEKQYLRKHRDVDGVLKKYLVDNEIIASWGEGGEYVPVSRQLSRIINGRV